GRAHRQLGDYENALRFTQMADSLLKIANENPFNKVSFYSSLGESYFWLGMDALAEKNALQAIHIAESLNTHTYLIRTYNLLTHIYERTGEYDKAFNSQKQYITLRDSITGE